MWCLMRIAAVGVATDWLTSISNMPGVQHDDEWIVYTHIPPQELLDQQGYITFEGGTESDVTALGKILINAGPDAIVVSPHHVLSTLYRTPEWRLWCARYESDTDPIFIDDKATVGLPEALTQEQAKTAIKTAISEAP